MTSYFTHNEPCPRCRAKGEDKAGDNLSTYSDGHKFCFKCSYFVEGDKLYKLKAKSRDVKVSYPKGIEFSKETLEYLKSYDLTDDEIEQHFEGHPDGYMFKDTNYFLIRRLYKKPKVIIEGVVVGNEPIFVNDDCKDAVVLCEDILSAVKINRVASSCALLKTSISDILIYRLATKFNKCILWLDPDMYDHMSKVLLPKLLPYFTSVNIVLSLHDPKVHTTEQIKEYLNGI